MVEFELEDWFEEMVVTGGTRPELMLQLMDLTEEPAFNFFFFFFLKKKREVSPFQCGVIISINVNIYQ